MMKIINNAYHYHFKSSRGIYYSMMFLSLFSIVMVASASISNASSPGYIFGTVLKNLAFLIANICCYFLALACYKTDSVSKHLLLICSFAIIALVAAIFITRHFYGSSGINGAYAWLIVHPKFPTIQPSEFIKPLMIAINATLLADRSFKRLKPLAIVFWPICFFAIVCIIVAFGQHDLGTVFIICGISTLTFLIPSHKKLKKLQIADAVLIGMVCAVFLLLLDNDFLQKVQSLNISFLEVTLNRFRSAIDPSFDITGVSREIYNSLYSIASGGLKGVGLGNSVQKYGYINATESDYIFAIIVEELGLKGILMVFVPYTVMLFNLIKYSLKVEKDSQKTVLIGVAAYLFIHLFLNVGGVTGLVPLTGIPLLLVSSGGSAQMAFSIALGMAQRVIVDYKNEKKAGILK